MGVLTGGRGNQNLTETKYEANNLHTIYLKGVKKVRSVQKLFSLVFNYNASKLKNDITRL